MMPIFELVAQLVEHRTFNPWVVGSIPTELNFSLRQQVGVLFRSALSISLFVESLVLAGTLALFRGTGTQSVVWRRSSGGGGVYIRAFRVHV